MPGCALQRATTMIVLSLVAASPAFPESRTGFSMYVDRHMAQVWPWRDEARFDAFAIVTNVAEKLWQTGAFGSTIATLVTDTFEGYPLLVLTDEDGDGEADFYAYEGRGDDTLEFGAYFTEPGSDAPYWLVFNSGPGLVLSDDGQPVSYWINYQFVDRNRDGKFDTYAVNNLDYDGDGHGSATDVLWLYDDDFDGSLDRGEHIVEGISHEIPILDGVFQTKRLGDDTSDHRFRLGDPIGEFADLISADIRKALTEGDRPENEPLVPYLPDFTFSGRVDDLEGWQEVRLADLKVRHPAGPEWSIEKSDEHVQVLGGREFDSAGALLTVDMMGLTKDVVSNPIFGDWNVAELATRYREWEIANMRQAGDVLSDVQMGEAEIAGNTSYFLRHFHLFDPPLDNGARRVRQELHLVFPPDFAETHVFYKFFLMRYCLHEQCDNDELDVSYLRQALGQVSF